jgi:hypothetical protein
MKLFDTDGDPLKFLKTRNTDGNDHFATRAKTRDALLKFLKGEATYSDLVVRYVSEPSVEAYSVGVIIVRGLLKIGCHTFNRANSKKILRWLGIGPVQFATARKIGKKVARGL